MSFFLSVCLTVCPHVFLWFYLTIFLSFCLPLFLSFYHSMSSSHFDCLSFLQLVTLSISESISLFSLCLLCCLFSPFSGTSSFSICGGKKMWKCWKKLFWLENSVWSTRSLVKIHNSSLVHPSWCKLQQDNK